MNKRYSVVAMILCMIFVMLCVPALAEDASAGKGASPDFKQFYWGDSKEKVMQVEGEPLAEFEQDNVDATVVAYGTTVAGLDASLFYAFCDDGLYQVMYSFTEEHSNESLYINDYEKIKAALTKKYGKPSFDEEIWENDSKKKYYADKKGDALCYGYLQYGTVYNTDTSRIMMVMSADNYEITMGVRYDSLTISPGEPDYSDQL